MPRDPRKVGFRVKGLGVPKSRGSFWKGPHSKDDRIFEGFILESPFRETTLSGAILSQRLHLFVRPSVLFMRITAYL